MRKFLLDTDSLVTSKNLHYAMDICPGFWDILLHVHTGFQILSIRPVLEEINNGKGDDELTCWVKDCVPKPFFLPVDDDDCQAAFREIMGWMTGSDYREAAKQRFAHGADPWLIAAALTHNCTIVTYEQPAPDSKRKIKLPDAARPFKVKCTRPHDMLRVLEAKLHFKH